MDKNTENKTFYDVKSMSDNQLKSLCQDLRNQIISAVKNSGGHLSSNLGIVETTVALYRTFDFPKDKLIFDVGHQCYAHKILSGRGDKFNTLRQGGGISGFPDKEESEYDSFSVGHAGTSISAGLGMCSARDIKGEDYTVINVVGDGALFNGLNLEALTASDKKPKNYIVILNDNGMSISANVNGLYKKLSQKTTKDSYIKGKKAIKKIFGNSFVTRFLGKIKNFIKRILGGNFFESLGFKYVGVVDGNDINQLVKIFSRVKDLSKYRPILVHIKTQKGKGLLEAEEHSDLYHGVGKNLKTSSGGFSEVLGNKLNSLIDKDKNIVAITAGMKDGTGLKEVEKEHPDNFYDVGIAEEYAVTFAAGMATGGLKPFVAIYSTFLQRAYDQVLHDVCLQNLPVIFCIDRAGFVGEDGKTHQGVFDLSYLSHMPNMTILAPTTKAEFEDSIDYALSLNSPVAIRYSKNCDFVDKTVSFEKEAWIKDLKSDNPKITVIYVGSNMKKLALDFAKILKDDVDVISARVVKPLDEKTLKSISSKIVVTLEENSVIGGFGASVLSYFAKDGNVKVLNFGVNDKFVSHGTVLSQMQDNGLTVENMIKSLEKYLNFKGGNNE